MPFINRSINSHNQPQPVYQMVKQEPLDSELMESPISQQNKEVAEGKWNEQQNLKFIIFVSYYQDIFSSKQKRKTCKIFKTFEEYLKDRTAAQCRSHFQKIMLKFKTVAKLRKHFENHYGKELFLEEFLKFKVDWQETHPPVTAKMLQLKEFKEFGIQTENQPIPNQNSLCTNCALPSPTQPVAANYNPYIYWNQLTQNFEYYYPMPPQESSQAPYY